MAHCLLATERLNQLLARLADCLPASGVADRFSGLELFASPADGTTVLVLQTRLTDPAPTVPPSLADLADQVLVELVGPAAQQGATTPGAGEGKAGPRQQIAFLVCYNIDGFRAYADEHRLLSAYRLDKAERRRLERDDGALLRFGFQWLEMILGGRRNLVPR